MEAGAAAVPTVINTCTVASVTGSAHAVQDGQLPFQKPPPPGAHDPCGLIVELPNTHADAQKRRDGVPKYPAAQLKVASTGRNVTGDVVVLIGAGFTFTAAGGVGTAHEWHVRYEKPGKPALENDMRDGTTAPGATE